MLLLIPHARLPGTYGVRTGYYCRGPRTLRLGGFDDIIRYDLGSVGDWIIPLMGIRLGSGTFLC